MRILEAVTQLLTGLWVGSMAGFALIAPLLFRAFGDERGRAGDLVGAMIGRLSWVGSLLGVIALLALLPRLRSRLNCWRALLLAGAVSVSLLGLLYVIPQMERARPPKPIESYAQNDPIRVAYNRWHKLSERVFGTGIFLGAATILLGPFVKERDA
jgi:MFS family permease